MLAASLSSGGFVPGGVWDGEGAELPQRSLNCGRPTLDSQPGSGLLPESGVLSPQLPRGSFCIHWGMTLRLWENMGPASAQGRKFIWQRVWCGPEEGEGSTARLEGLGRGLQERN